MNLFSIRMCLNHHLLELWFLGNVDNLTVSIDWQFPNGGARRDFWGCEKNLPMLPLVKGVVDYNLGLPYVLLFNKKQFVL